MKSKYLNVFMVICMYVMNKINFWYLFYNYFMLYFNHEKMRTVGTPSKEELGRRRANKTQN